MRRLLTMARAHDPALADWISAEGAFPQTMVDRIVPATTAQDIALTSRGLGMEDRGAVKTEPFLQWVIEDRFAGPHPDFAALGVQIVDDVTPWEAAKLRLLNGAHSAIAYLAGLAGIATVYEFIAQPAGRRYVERLWDEAQTTIDVPSGLDVAAYRDALMSRFANRALAHATRQIAVDGSQKLPQRLVAPLLARHDRQAPFDALALAIAAWMRWQGGLDEAGRAFTVDDPLAGWTAAALAGCGSPHERVRALLTIDAIFPSRLVDDLEIVETIAQSLARIERDGALAALTLKG